MTFVTQWFAPEPSVQPVRIAKALQSAGFDVQVLTGVPNYPVGKAYDGYRASRGGKEELEGLPVHRTPLFPSHDKSTVRRMLNYISWALSAALLGRKAFKGSDVALVYSSPATAALPAMLARRLRGTPYVLLIQDVWPDSVFAAGFLHGRLGGVIEKLVNIPVLSAYKGASRIAVISPGMRDLLKSRGVPGEKIVLVYNAVEKDEDVTGAPRDRGTLGLSPDDVVFMYAGNHGAAQDLTPLVRAMGELPETSPAQLLLLGDGVEKEHLQAVAAEHAHDRVRFLSSVPRSEMTHMMDLADVQVVALADRPLFKVTMPSKVQSILSDGRPLLALARGDVARVVEDAACGATATPGNVQSIVVAIQALTEAGPEALETMGASGRSYYENEMSPERSMRQLCLALEASMNENVRTVSSASKDEE